MSRFYLLPIILIVIIAWSPLFAAPKDPENYIRLTEPLADIPDGAIVEGSLRTGGTQPDYVVDMKTPELQPLWQYARRLKNAKLDFWVKVERITHYVSERILPRHDYDDKAYTTLLKRYKSAHMDIPLSRYAACGAGVCRENALLLHLALKEAGIPNKHVYAEIHRSSHANNYNIVEDHAFTVVKHEGRNWVVDSYYWGFNGFTFEDLLSPDGITKDSLMAPTATPAPGFRRIIKVHPFPVVWAPKKLGYSIKEPDCASLFKSLSP
jgi:hypothetical protein